MPDMEKVIKGLEKCKRYECDDCTEKGASQAPWDCSVYDDFVDSAIALLKEQEPVGCINNHGILLCGRCKNIIGYDDGYGRSYKGKFCCECGRAVK